MRGFLVDVETGDAREVDACGLADYYRLLRCNLVDITCRKIAGEWRDIVCDDEGLLKSGARVSAVQEGKPALVGSLLIFNCADGEGEMQPLSAADVQALRGRLLPCIHGDGVAGVCIALDADNAPAW